MAGRCSAALAGMRTGAAACKPKLECMFGLAGRHVHSRLSSTSDIQGSIEPEDTFYSDMMNMKGFVSSHNERYHVLIIDVKSMVLKTTRS